MNNTKKLLLASLIVAGTAAQTVLGGGIEGMPFKIQNKSGQRRFLYVRFLNPQDQTLEPIAIPDGADFSLPNMPQIISAYNPTKEGSEVGLVLQPDKLIGKKVYLEAKLFRKGGVGLKLKKGIKDNIDNKSFLEAKKAFKEWKKEVLEQPTTIE